MTTNSLTFGVCAAFLVMASAANADTGEWHDPTTTEPDRGGWQEIGTGLEFAAFVHELVTGLNTLGIEAVLSSRADPEGRVVPEVPLQTGQVQFSTNRSVPEEPDLGLTPGQRRTGGLGAPQGDRRFVILMICDGWGGPQIEAANLYAAAIPSYQSDPRWTRLWVSTYPADGSYDSVAAWSDPTYPLLGATDSAAAATAMFCGRKTSNGRVAVNVDGDIRLSSLGERSRALGGAHGAVTSVHVSHATPGGFTAHNLSRGNTFAIGDEAFFGDPNSTGSPAVDSKYGGGLGRTLPPTEVLIGTYASGYLHRAQIDRLLAENGQPGRHTVVQGTTGMDGGAALLIASLDPATTMLAGLFERADLRVTEADGGYRVETPRLAESAQAAIAVLERNPKGFVLLVEGGAVDWGGHANDLDRVIGELLDFNEAVAAVIEWVDDPSNASHWENTLVIITGDHETGYLTAAPGGFPNQAFAPGSINSTTLALERVRADSGRRASWIDDGPENNLIDPGETVYWVWNTDGHSNSLIPVFARGVGAAHLEALATEVDLERGPYVDNTDVFLVAATVLDHAAIVFADGFESGGFDAWVRAVNYP